MGVSPKDLIPKVIAKVIVPVDEGLSLEEKLYTLKLNLEAAERLDELNFTDLAAKKADMDPDEFDRLAIEVNRQMTRAALIAVMQFLEAAGVAQRGKSPDTLWRLIYGLAELDDTGNVSPLFRPDRTPRGDSGTAKGKRPDTRHIVAAKASVAVAMEIAHTDCGMPKDQAAAYVARAIDNPMVRRSIKQQINAGTVASWRDACIGYGNAAEWVATFDLGCETIRAAGESPEYRLKRALNAVQVWAKRLSKI